MAKHLLENAAAEQEANDIGSRYMNSSDVLSDMIRDYGGVLNGVKVHDDAAADAKVRAVGRDGLASGKDVYMREGSLSSGDPASKGLLAHELTHVMQQDGGMQESVDYGEAQGGLIDWFKSKFGGKKKQQAAPAPAAAPVPQMVATPRALQAQGQIAAKDQANHDKSAAFTAAAARYNQSRGDGEEFLVDKQDVRRQRFLQRHMTGTDDENDALFRDVMTRGDAAMMPYFTAEARRMMDFDGSKVQDDEWLLQNGGELITQNNDVHNLFDMINDGRVKPEDIGFSPEEFAKLVGTWDPDKKKYIGGKKGDYAIAGGTAQLRLKQIGLETAVAGQKTSDQTFGYRSTAAPSGDFDPAEISEDQGLALLYRKIKNPDPQDDEETISARKRMFAQMRAQQMDREWRRTHR